MMCRLLVRRAGGLVAFSLMLTTVLSCTDSQNAGNSDVPTIAESSSVPSTVSDENSVYDGIYKGIFIYEYQVVTWDEDKDLPGCMIISQWIPSVIEVRLTFKTRFRAIEDGWVEVEIVHVICDDPVFAADGKGCTPNKEPGAYARLPMPPVRVLKSGEGVLLVINFPNGSYLHTKQGSSNPGTFSASPDGMNLSFSYNFTGFEDYGVGAYSGFAHMGPFAPQQDYPDYFVRTTGWSLVKEACQSGPQ